jgi:uncharacterized protein YecE (DUF72 family)
VGQEKMALVYMGTSGHYYNRGIGNFHPEQIKQDEWLTFYSSMSRTVELNTTFYHRPKAKTIDGCLKKTPDEFIYSVKVHRSITHQKKLLSAENELFRLLSLSSAHSHAQAEFSKYRHSKRNEGLEER